MKNYFLFLFLGLVLFCGCKKEDPAPQSPTTASIVNLWELQINISDNYTNGNLTSGDTTFGAPNDLWVRFKNNNTCIEYENTIPTDTGIYTFSNNILTLISGQDTIKYTTTLSSNSLVIHNIQTDIAPPDTFTMDSRLTFRMIH